MQSFNSVRLFVSYSHKDQALVDELLAHLQPLIRQGRFSVWHNRLLSAGINWKKEVQKQIDQAQIIVVSISPDYLADEDNNEELEYALARQKSGRILVAPVLIRPVSLIGSPLDKLHVLFNKQALSQRDNRDEAWLEAMQVLNKLSIEVEKIRQEMGPGEKNSQGFSLGSGGRGGRGTGERDDDPRKLMQTFSSKDYAQLGLMVFVINTLLLVGFVTVAHWLLADGVQERRFFSLLIGLGLVVALFTFGTMRLYSYYKGKRPNGTLEIGGPFLATIIFASIGLYMPTNESFSMIVRVMKDGKRIRSGTVIVDIGPDRRENQLDLTGEANFEEIPKNMWLKKAKFEVDGLECNMPLGSDEHVLQKVVTLVCDSSEKIYLHTTQDHPAPNISPTDLKTAPTVTPQPETRLGTPAEFRIQHGHAGNRPETNVRSPNKPDEPLNLSCSIPGEIEKNFKTELIYCIDKMKESLINHKGRGSNEQILYRAELRRRQDSSYYVHEATPEIKTTFFPACVESIRLEKQGPDKIRINCQPKSNSL